jgi:hypothetical protein
MITSHSLMAVRERHEIKQETRHLTAGVWRMLIVVVCLILIFGASMKLLHGHGVKQKELNSNVVRSSR